ncbi:PHB depolymerase family esterase [uncultured Fibrobacter sp.]|uniref:PHB depolymerase family esterase n=1 Tax=uncultured Fibrobacter sp. TaxID=261512 RepID=UPI0025DDBA98|nr:PHB depolymerase family esterase [uncultured Fibrobacter sp.]
MRTAILFFFAATISFAQWGGGGGGGKSLNDYQKKSVSGREIHVYAPSGLKENSPLLISCHGMDQDPNYQQSNTHWEAVADTAGFVVVYPRGGTGYNTWDISGDKDTKWMVEIIDQMYTDYKIDKKRVYLSGFSMGGMFTYHSMSKIADKIAAFAPTSGTNVMGASKAQRPVPIIHPHGTNDDVLPYNNVEGFIKNYRDQFHCPDKAEEQTNYPNAENNGATMYTWGPCDKGVYIKHLKLPGRGHSPSKADVSDIWNFVKEWTVDGKVGEASTTESSASTPASSADVAKSSSSGVTGPNSSGNVAKSSSSGSHHHHGSSSSITNVTSSGAVSSSGAVGVLSSAGIIASIAQPADPSLLLVSVYKSSDNYIVVANAQGKTITVFNSLGHVVSTTRGLGTQQKVYTGAKGVYIVKVGSRTFKTSL